MELRKVTEADLAVFFEHQRDPEAQRMAGFEARELEPFLSHWHANVLRPEHLTRTLVVDGIVIGYVGSWNQEGLRLLAYWLGREHWGKGHASRALAAFLAVETLRPLHAWVAAHNTGSIRVLEKNGFRTVREESPASADGVAEILLGL